MNKKKEIAYLDSFTANTSIVPEVIDKLYQDLQSAGYPREEIDEIVLSMDESITNAVQVTMTCTPPEECTVRTRNITIRYTINDTEFDATIIDHGTGLDFIKIFGTLPDNNSNNYFDQIVSYATDSEKAKLSVKINGEEIPLRGIGAGLKIILTFMDSVTIEYIDKKSILSSSVSDYTDGTIFNIKRKRRYH
ncbi:MAG TPA: ATP-binding protein [Spirochaetota bacterium]|nr:ATP-binding protein [Spirochaetota bacterium]